MKYTLQKCRTKPVEFPVVEFIISNTMPKLDNLGLVLACEKATLAKTMRIN